MYPVKFEYISNQVDQLIYFAYKIFYLVTFIRYHFKIFVMDQLVQLRDNSIHKLSFCFKLQVPLLHIDFIIA